MLEGQLQMLLEMTPIEKEELHKTFELYAKLMREMKAEGSAEQKKTGGAITILKLTPKTKTFRDLVADKRFMGVDLIDQTKGAK